MTMDFYVRQPAQNTKPPIKKDELMYKTLTSQESRTVVGGNGYIYRCWDTKGKVYWDRRPNSAGCVNTVTGKTEKDSKNPQRGSGK
ncbi:MAG: hypothetical protein ACRCXB_21425 [Aeromonadaceae bacterium]